MNATEKLIIGIDPDVTRSGLAIRGRETGELTLKNLSFFELFDLLAAIKDRIETVKIEAGWLNSSNWHATGGKSYAAQIGNRTGRNHQTGILIAEGCEHLGIKFELIRPARSKTDARLFKRLTGYQGRTNSEQRDAAMMIL
jgi:hypothetical protein